MDKGLVPLTKVQILDILDNATKHIEHCEREFAFNPHGAREPFTFGGFENEDIYG